MEFSGIQIRTRNYTNGSAQNPFVVVPRLDVSGKYYLRMQNGSWYEMQTRSEMVGTDELQEETIARKKLLIEFVGKGSLVGSKSVGIILKKTSLSIVIRDGGIIPKVLWQRSRTSRAT